MWEEFLNWVDNTGLSFDEILALYKLYSYENNTRKIVYDSDMLNTYLDLESKRMIKVITNENGALTFHLREGGSTLIQRFIDKKSTEKPETTHKPEIKKIQNNQHKFEEFWLLFPSSDEHGIYRKSRILKANKDTCKKKYIALLEEGQSHEDIIKALKYEIKLRRDSNNKSNNMTYMKNSLTWLNQKEYEVILETMDDDNNSNSDNDWTSNLA